MIEEDLDDLWHALIHMAKKKAEEENSEEARHLMRQAMEIRRVRDMCRAGRAREVFELAMLSVMGAGEDMEALSRNASHLKNLSSREKELYASLINILGEFMSYEGE